MPSGVPQPCPGTPPCPIPAAFGFLVGFLGVLLGFWSGSVMFPSLMDAEIPDVGTLDVIPAGNFHLPVADGDFSHFYSIFFYFLLF